VEVIVKEYARRYSTKLAGWWFDHAGFGNIPLRSSMSEKEMHDFAWCIRG
jgi:hypothetical protein